MSNDATQDITTAYWDLGDYFSRLGWAGRYWNMPESDIPLFIGCELAKKISSDFDETEYLNGMFLDAAAPVLDKISKGYPDLSVFEASKLACFE